MDDHRDPRSVQVDNNARYSRVICAGSIVVDVAIYFGPTRPILVLISARFRFFQSRNIPGINFKIGRRRKYAEFAARPVWFFRKRSFARDFGTCPPIEPKIAYDRRRCQFDPFFPTGEEKDRRSVHQENRPTRNRRFYCIISVFPMSSTFNIVP
ncbi:uncharacterized protein LOC143191844 [Rhynchophorus ferrugineus]|uniref:uncharacterized protein LOC143191844 n=1 Tax=Rhynchophorus ferrugineus TaxID=354439 RepID=UPI003FCD0D52